MTDDVNGPRHAPVAVRLAAISRKMLVRDESGPPARGDRSRSDRDIMMTLSERRQEPTPAGASRSRRFARLLGPAGLAALAYFAWELVTIWLSWRWATFGRSVQRDIVIGFLKVLLAAYILVAASAGAGLAALVVVLTCSPGRPSRRPRLARLFLLCISSVISLAGLELGAAVWLSWLHRSPSLPKAEVKAEVQPAETLPELTTEFRRQGPGSPREPLRILVIGESSARGEPYHPWLSVGQIVGWQLERILAGRPVEVDIRAEGGVSMEQVHQKLAGLTYRPDALIVCSGHNEFQARYSWSRNPPYYIEEQEHKAEAWLQNDALRISPVCRLILETLDRQRIDAIPSPVATRQLVDRPVCTAAEAAEILADFRRRLGSIAAYCERIGTLPILIIPASNDGGYEPSRSALPADVPSPAREAFAREFRHARRLEKESPSLALNAYRTLLDAYPDFAETHYRLARLLEHSGTWDEARDHYLKARECDAMPLRCPEPFRRVYREIASWHLGVILVDSERVETLSPHGILDDHLFHDAQHPTFRGYLALAQDLLNQLHERHAFGWPAGTPVPTIDADDCARHFRLDAAKWAEVCRRSAWFYEVTAYIRHDPWERRGRMEAYRRARELVASGKSPEQAGVAGLGVHPTPTPAP
jgi:tetratricopeptide (TPR) repeat protein